MSERRNTLNRGFRPHMGHAVQIRALEGGAIGEVVANGSRLDAVLDNGTTSGTVPEVRKPHAITDDIDIAPGLAKLNETDKEAVVAKLTDAEVVARMEEYVFVPVREAVKPLAEVKAKIKDIITQNHALILEARRRFHAQGRRVPVLNPDGTRKPTYNEWLKANLTCSGGYVRKVQRESLAALTVIEPQREKRPGKSDRRQREERVLSLAVELAEAVFDNPVRARELATTILKEAGVPVPASPASLGPVEKQPKEESNDKVVARLQAQFEKLKEMTDLAMQACEIIAGAFGGRLMAREDGKRLVDIAKKALAMRGKLTLR